MINEISREMEWGGRVLSLSHGLYARRARSSVLVKYGNTVVLCTVTVSKKNKFAVEEKSSGMGLVVHFLAKAYARGRMPQGFFKREGKPSDRETLASRLIDRSIRPLIPSEIDNEINVICGLFAHDGLVAPEVPALIGAVAALGLSEIPLKSTVIGSQVSVSKNGDYVLNPDPVANKEDLENLDLVIGSTNEAITMVECEANSLSKSAVVEGMFYGYERSKPVISFVEDFVREVKGKDKLPVEVDKAFENLVEEVGKSYNKELESVYSASGNSKEVRVDILDDIYSRAIAEFSGEEFSVASVLNAVKSLEKRMIRSKIVSDNKRIDGRNSKQIRPIDIRLDILAQSHGSALFTRGDTQALVTTTLGTYQDEQVVDDMEGDRREHFMLHYNFMPYAVGEVGALRPPGRREIGHGKLAQKAVKSVLPNKEDFSYTVRVVSDITDCNGSSSMATVCGASLALMDAAVPIKKHVAGIAMGLVTDNEKYVILSDILGDEDHLGDMDFKVAGTEDGITALQMDVKIGGINKEIATAVLDQAEEGVLHILSLMNSAMPKPNMSVKSTAPCILSYSVDKDKVSKIIGSKGKVIRELCETTGAKIDIESNGKVYITADKKVDAENAYKMIEDIIAEPKSGVIYDGAVTGIADFGVFVKIVGGNQGLVHISEISDSRIESIGDLITVNDTVKVIVLGIEKGGNIRLSMRRVDQQTGEEIEGDFKVSGYPKDRDSSSKYSSSRKFGSGGGLPRRSGGSRGGGNAATPSYGNGSNSGGKRKRGEGEDNNSFDSSNKQRRRFF